MQAVYTQCGLPYNIESSKKKLFVFTRRRGVKYSTVLAGGILIWKCSLKLKFDIITLEILVASSNRYRTTIRTTPSPYNIQLCHQLYHCCHLTRCVRDVTFSNESKITLNQMHLFSLLCYRDSIEYHSISVGCFVNYFVIT